MYIFDNPEFIRLVRTKLRPKTMLSYALGALMIFGGAIAFTYWVETSMNRWGLTVAVPISRIMRSSFFAVTGLQLAVTALFGVGLAAQNVTLEKERVTLDFQRLVAMGPTRLAIGKLFGAPAEAFFMTAIGSIFALFTSLGSDLPFDIFIQSQIVVFGFGVVASSFGLMCSSISEKTQQATGMAVGLGIPLYSAYSSWSNSSVWGAANPIFLLKEFSSGSYSFFVSTIDFCHLRLPYIVGFLIINPLLVWLNVTIASRRIADVELSFMTPRQGLIAFLIVQALLFGDTSSYGAYNGLTPLKVFHFTNLFTFIFLAFALTPGAELVRGRVFRASQGSHWKVVFEFTNRLQDSPSIMAMLHLSLAYIVSTAIHVAIVIFTIAPPGNVVLFEILLTIMNVSIGLAVAGMLLYIQVYSDKGCFKTGILLLMLALLVPPIGMLIATLHDPLISSINFVRISPFAYINGIEKLNDNGSMLISPAVCATLAVAFCVLSALRIRFLLDVEQVKRDRAAKVPTA